MLHKFFTSTVFAVAAAATAATAATSGLATAQSITLTPQQNYHAVVNKSFETKQWGQTVTITFHGDGRFTTKVLLLTLQGQWTLDPAQGLCANPTGSIADMVANMNSGNDDGDSACFWLQQTGPGLYNTSTGSTLQLVNS